MTCTTSMLPVWYFWMCIERGYVSSHHWHIKNFLQTQYNIDLDRICGGSFNGDFCGYLLRLDELLRAMRRAEGVHGACCMIIKRMTTTKLLDLASRLSKFVLMPESSVEENRLLYTNILSLRPYGFA